MEKGEPQRDERAGNGGAGGMEGRIWGEAGCLCKIKTTDVRLPLCVIFPSFFTVKRGVGGARRSSLPRLHRRGAGSLR